MTKETIHTQDAQLVHKTIELLNDDRLQFIDQDGQTCVLIDDLQVDYTQQSDGSIYDLDMEMCHTDMKALVAFHTEDRAD